MYEFSIGDRVKHVMLGNGTVTAILDEETIEMACDKSYGITNTKIFGVFVDSLILI